jgi:Zn-dependent peptidase ImmA (M78 family)
MNRIVAKANEIRRKYGLDDLNSVVEKLGTEIVELPLGSIIREAYFKDLGVIVIDPELRPYKKRHLVAHGLAHHLFHRKSKVNYFLNDFDDFLRSLKVRKQELEAEVFAAYFLIPENKLNAVLKEHEDSPNPIPELADEFQVSENFMRKRLEFAKLLS